LENLIDDRFHVPVLRDQVVSLLLTHPGGMYVDGTVGGGGHAEALCGRLSNEGKLIGFDIDREAIRRSTERLAQFGPRVLLIRENFSGIRTALNLRGISSIHGLLLDLGVSSFQFDEPARGFSYRHGARIDMRMDDRQSLTGWHVVNTYGEEDLSEMIKTYGEERYARRIARVLCASRPIESTQELRDVIGSAVGGRYLTKTLSRVFQAIRIEVNRELMNLEICLKDVVPMLVPGGRVAVISYHSLEDRIVKQFFRENTNGLRVITRKPLVPSPEETERNPRARSAKLRVAERPGPE
jgi:16S rRNA (cytosine1402-N4)-methyltransferase